MLPGMEVMACPGLAVPPDVMQHVVHVESSFNPYAIGVVGGRLVRQPRNLPEAVATARMLEGRGYNFSLGLAQVNRYNLARYGLASYEAAFEPCANLQAGSRILADCHARAARDWGKSFSCYYSGNFTTGFRAGYVQKIFASMQAAAPQVSDYPGAIAVVGRAPRTARATATWPAGRASRIDAFVPSRREPIGPASAPVPARVEPPTASLPTAPVDAGIAVLQPDGQPPRLMPTDASPQPAALRPASPPPAAAPARDAAFVF